MSDPFEAIRAHVENHAGKERATFTVAGVKALLEAAAALSPVQPVPGVKELEWHGPDYEDKYWAAWVGGTYTILAANGNGRWVGGVGGYSPTIEAAKAAAQADFEARIRSSLLPTPQPVEGPSEPVAYCQPMKDGEHQPRQFIVWFEDRDKGIATFDDEAEARAYWENANINWNCYLFGALSRDATPPSPAQGTVERAEPNFAETLNFYISDAENGLCRVPRQKMVEIQTELRLLASPARAEAVTVSIKPMKLSDDRCDYFVAFKCGEREVTPHVFRERFKAEYHVAEYRWLFGQGPKPGIMEFRQDEWPAREFTAEEQRAFAALDAALSSQGSRSDE